MEAREEKPFESLSDFISRVDTQKVYKKVMEALIKSGALDCFGHSRRALFNQIETIIEAGQKCSQAKKMALNSLFGDNEEMTTVHVEIMSEEEYELKSLLALEKESIGFYISGHPLDDFKEEMKDLKYTLSSEIDQIDDGSKAMFVGKVEEITTKISKKGNRFGIVNLMDLHGNIELTVFEKDLKKLEDMNLEEPLAFKVAITRDDQFVKTRTLKMMSLQDARKEKIETKIKEAPAEPMYIKINIEENVDALDELYAMIQNHRGRRPLTITITSKLQDIVMETNLYVDDALGDEIGKSTYARVDESVA